VAYVASLSLRALVSGTGPRGRLPGSTWNKTRRPGSDAPTPREPITLREDQSSLGSVIDPFRGLLGRLPPAGATHQMCDEPRGRSVVRQLRVVDAAAHR
jgi:hypothetical protein